MQNCISLFPQTSENKKEGFDLDLPAIENKERQTKPDFRDVAVQTNSTATIEITGRLTAGFV